MKKVKTARDLRIPLVILAAPADVPGLAASPDGLKNTRDAAKAEPVLETLGYEQVRLLPSFWRRQQRDVLDSYLAVSSDDYLKGFRERAGTPAPGEELGGWYSHDVFNTFGQIVSGLARLHAATRTANPFLERGVRCARISYRARLDSRGVLCYREASAHPAPGGPPPELGNRPSAIETPKSRDSRPAEDKDAPGHEHHPPHRHGTAFRPYDRHGRPEAVPLQRRAVRRPRRRDRGPDREHPRPGRAGPAGRRPR